MRSRCSQVATLPTGEIDYEELEEQLRAHADRPAILNVNIGTTVRSCSARGTRRTPMLPGFALPAAPETNRLCACGAMASLSVGAAPAEADPSTPQVKLSDQMMRAAGVRRGVLLTQTPSALQCRHVSGHHMRSFMARTTGARRSGRPRQGAAHPDGHRVQRRPLLHPLRRRPLRPHGAPFPLSGSAPLCSGQQQGSTVHLPVKAAACCAWQPEMRFSGTGSATHCAGSVVKGTEKGRKELC